MGAGGRGRGRVGWGGASGCREVNGDVMDADFLLLWLAEIQMVFYSLWVLGACGYCLIICEHMLVLRWSNIYKCI